MFDFAQDIGALEAIGIFALATAALYLSAHTDALVTRVALRTLGLAFWFMALLRMYSATSYIWAPDVDRNVLGFLRLAIVSMSTAVLIILMAHVVVLYRQVRRRQGGSA